MEKMGKIVPKVSRRDFGKVVLSGLGSLTALALGVSCAPPPDQTLPSQSQNPENPGFSPSPWNLPLTFRGEGVSEFEAIGAEPGEYSMFAAAAATGSLNAAPMAEQYIAVKLAEGITALGRIAGGAFVTAFTLLNASAMVAYQANGGMRQLVEGPDANQIPWGQVAQIRADANEYKALNENMFNGEYSAGGPGKNWRPPEKDYCSEDMQKYYAQLLLDETLGSLIAAQARIDKSIFDNLNSIPIYQDEARFSQEREAIRKRLMENNCYFYGGGKGSGEWSVFMDYKVMRKEYVVKLGKGMGKTGDDAMYSGFEKLSSQFNPNMTTQQAYDLAYKIVGQWWP